MPFISVIIPLYNKAAQIEQTLKYVLQQDFKDFEIIIVNDGSTDNSLSIAETFNDSRIKIFNQENQGAGAARNYGVTKAQSEHIALLDADDVWYSNHLQCLHDSIKAYPNHAWYSNAYSVKHSEKLTVQGNYNIELKNTITVVTDYFKSSIIHPLAWTSCVVFKKSIFKILGQFDPSILSGQDLDLWFKFGLQYPLVFNNTYTSIYDKTVIGSLSKENHQEAKYQLFSSYDDKAETHEGFKYYLTTNKYSLAIQCKLANNLNTFKKLRKDIDADYLNKKQRFILYQPVFMTRFLKGIYKLMVKNNLYSSAYN